MKYEIINAQSHRERGVPRPLLEYQPTASVSLHKLNSKTNLQGKYHTKPQLKSLLISYLSDWQGALSLIKCNFITATVLGTDSDKYIS